MSKTKLAALLFTLFILWLIVTADSGIFPPFLQYFYQFPGGDKAGHFILYGILTFLMVLAFPRRQHWGWISLASATIILAVLITLEEFSQSFFPSRTFSMLDLSFSFLGIFTGDWLAGHFGKKS